MITTLDLILPFQYFFHLTCLFKYLKVHLNNKQSSALLIYSFFFKWSHKSKVIQMIWIHITWFDVWVIYVLHCLFKNKKGDSTQNLRVVWARVTFDVIVRSADMSHFLLPKKKKKTMEGKKKKLYSLCVSPIIVNYLWSSSLGSRKCEAQRSCIYFWHVLQFESDPYGSLHNCGSEAPTGPNHRLHIKNST